eukprot:TRINITY_DN1164_c0_g1_i6.p2 TRINITY_DN1164_c0_g1~~TRINITY_DN1164_c0_g1_i6.p2  ORF type:complete len:394 (+),score=32.52 TRINITY_DN1164_c0_g1_i6:173-1183(+)
MLSGNLGQISHKTFPDAEMPQFNQIYDGQTVPQMVAILNDFAKPVFQVAQRASVDLVAAASAALCVCPFMMIVDKSVAENASGKRKLFHSLMLSISELARHPLKFYRRPELWVIFGVSSATYFTANFFDSIQELQQQQTQTESSYRYLPQLTSTAQCDPSGVEYELSDKAEQKSTIYNDHQLTKFVSTTIVNMTGSIMKDRIYAQMFGTGSPHALPVSCYACFGMRDALTTAAVFVLPSKVADEMHAYSGWSHGTCYTLAQLSCPVAAQLVTTPWHLLALDIYNRQDARIVERVNFVGREMVKSTFVRMGRIFPAFGIGGVSNKYFRDNLKANFLS